MADANLEEKHEPRGVSVAEAQNGDSMKSSSRNLTLAAIEKRSFSIVSISRLRSAKVSSSVQIELHRKICPSGARQERHHGPSECCHDGGPGKHADEPGERGDIARVLPECG